MEVKTVGVACDHAGYPLKKYVLLFQILKLEVIRKLNFPKLLQGLKSNENLNVLNVR